MLLYQIFWCKTSKIPHSREVKVLQKIWMHYFWQHLRHDCLLKGKMLLCWLVCCPALFQCFWTKEIVSFGSAFFTLEGHACFIWSINTLDICAWLMDWVFSNDATLSRVAKTWFGIRKATNACNCFPWSGFWLNWKEHHCIALTMH